MCLTSSCKKDFRDEYIGNYYFTTTYRHGPLSYVNDSPNTVNYFGHIEKSPDANRIVMFYDVNTVVKLKLHEDGILENTVVDENRVYEGAFIGFDKLNYSITQTIVCAKPDVGIFGVRY